MTERDTAETKLLKLSQEMAAKCEVLLRLLHVPQASKPPSPTLPSPYIYTALSPPQHCAQLQLFSSGIHIRTHTHARTTYTHIKSA